VQIFRAAAGHPRRHLPPTGGRSDPPPPIICGAMMKIIDWAAREILPRRLFLLFYRAEAARGRGARTTEIHRAVPSRSAAKDGAMAAIRLM